MEFELIQANCENYRIGSNENRILKTEFKN